VLLLIALSVGESGQAGHGHLHAAPPGLTAKSDFIIVVVIRILCAGCVNVAT